MVRRLLSLVLCLLAAVPQGVCTCAAAASTCPGSPRSAPPTPDRPIAHGQCQHHYHPTATADAEDADETVATVTGSPADPAHGHQDRDHAPGCRAVAGDPTGVRVVTVTAGRPPAEVGLLALADLAGACPAGLIARDHHAPPPSKLPLFLTLGVLLN